MKYFVIAFVLFLAVLSGSSNAAYYEVNMSGVVNHPFKSGIEPRMYPTVSMPSGQVTLGGVPFYLIPRGGNQTWYSGLAGSGTNSVIIPVGVQKAQSVNLIINSVWGLVGPYTRLEFTGSAGGYFEKNLYGNSDIRDWLNTIWTNQINNTTTVNVWSGREPTMDNNVCRMDKLQVDLPSNFYTQTLVSMRIVDWGPTGSHRSFVSAITVQAIPEPASVLSLLCGLGAIARLTTRRRLP